VKFGVDEKVDASTPNVPPSVQRVAAVGQKKLKIASARILPVITPQDTEYRVICR